MVEAWREVGYFKKTSKYGMGSYCEELRRRCAKAQSEGCGISPYTQAFILLDNSGMTEKDKKRILDKVEGMAKGEEFVEKVMRYMQFQEVVGMPLGPGAGMESYGKVYGLTKGHGKNKESENKFGEKRKKTIDDPNESIENLIDLNLAEKIAKTSSAKKICSDVISRKRKSNVQVIDLVDVEKEEKKIVGEKKEHCMEVIVESRVDASKEFSSSTGESENIDTIMNMAEKDGEVQ